MPLVVLGRSILQAAFRFSWSHLWSHSRKFRGVRSGLPRLGSGGTGPNRTGLNHQPQNSKVCEMRAPSAKVSPDRQAVARFPDLMCR
jgi:hypothetical protein